MSDESFCNRRLAPPKVWHALVALFAFALLFILVCDFRDGSAGKRQLAYNPNDQDSITSRASQNVSREFSTRTYISGSSTVDSRLSIQQCHKLNPNLKRILDELHAQYGHIRLDKAKHRQFERWCHMRRNGCMFVSIRGGRLSIKSMYPSMQSRHHSMIMAMYRVSSKFHLPDTDFAVEMWDGGADGSNLPLFRFSRDREGDQSRLIIPVPDFTFYTWPESVCGNEKSHAFSYLFSNFKEMSAKRENDPVTFVKGKRNTLMYRGAPIDRRPGWVKTINSIDWPEDQKPDIDVSVMEWLGQHNVRGHNPAKNCMGIIDQCKNRFLMHMDGVKYSSRLKYLMGCGGVVLMPQPRWEEWWFMGLPTRNETTTENEVFVQLNEDLSDFQKTFSDLYNSDQTSKDSRVVKMVERSQKFAMDVFSEDGVDCYWASVIQLAAERWGPIGEANGKPIEDAMINPNEAFSVL